MSNKIVKINKTKTSNVDSKEVYIDVSMYSRFNPMVETEIDYKPSNYNIDKLINVNAVMNSLTNIFLWLKGERIINPEFGSDLRKLIYEGITPLTEEKIVAEINQCVTKWEPRVTIEQVQNVSTTNDTEDNTIMLNIVFKIKGMDETYNKTFEFNKNE